MSAIAKNEMTKFYIDTLKNANLKKGTTQEGLNLYMLSFFGLLRCGCPFEIREDVIEEMPVEGTGKGKPKSGSSGKNTKNSKEAAAKDKKAANKNASSKNKPSSEKSSRPKEEQDEPDTIAVKTKKVIYIIIDRKGYGCDEDDLKAMFGQQYEDVVDKKNIVQDDEDDLDISLPAVDWGSYDDDEDEEKTEVGTLEVQGAERIDLIPFDGRFPDDEMFSKEYDSFLFDAHQAAISITNGETHKCNAVVYPLGLASQNIPAADIFVVTTDEEGNMRTGMSEWKENGQKFVTIEYDSYTLVFRGEWKNEKFTSSCALYATMDGEKARISTKVRHITPTRNTSSFFMRNKASDGAVMNVFPLSLLHNDVQSGLAPCVVVMEDGYTRKIYSADGTNSYMSIWFDRSQKKVEVYWAGNALHVHMDEET